MAFLTLSGIDLEVTEFRRLPDERGGGGLRRTINGKLRADVTWEARAWEAEVLCQTDVEAAAVYASANIQLDELALGIGTGSVTVRVEVTADNYRRLGDGGHWRYITLRLREQL